MIQLFIEEIRQTLMDGQDLVHELSNPGSRVSAEQRRWKRSSSRVMPADDQSYPRQAAQDA